MLKYKLYQSNREGEFKGKWYARVAYDDSDVVTTADLAAKIEAATTLTDTDVVACITAFLRYVREGLVEGRRVRLDKFGTFKCGISTSPADEAIDFSVSKNVRGVHIIFVPATSIDRSTGRSHRIKSLISGISLAEAGKYDVDKKAEKPAVTP